MSVAELFYDPLGGWDNGKSIGPIGGHDKHVHVGGDADTILAAGRLAKSMGLSVHENAYFGDKVDPVHTAGSWHYKTGKTKTGETVGLAIDVSGSPSAMARFTRAVRDAMTGGSGGGGGNSIVNALESAARTNPLTAGALAVGNALDITGAGDAAADVATAPARLIVNQLTGALASRGAELLLEIALILGGAMLALYGAMKAAGITPAKAADLATTAGAIAGAPTSGGASLAAKGATKGAAKTAANKAAKGAAR